MKASLRRGESGFADRVWLARTDVAAARGEHGERAVVVLLACAVAAEEERIGGG
jgi:hypothetical protein